MVSRNVTAERNGEAAEIDLLVVNDGEMIVVECKSNLSIDDVNEHLERLGKVKRLFPYYRDMKVMGAVAAMVIPDNVGKYAYKKGLFVLYQAGDNMVLKNDTLVVIMNKISQISRSFLQLFNLQIHRMGNLVFDNLNSESVLKLKNAPRTPLINLVFTSYQKEQIAYN